MNVRSERGTPRAFSVLAAIVTLAAVSLPGAPAWAGDPPKIKEGLWAIHGESIEKPSGSVSKFDYKLCRNHAYDKTVNAKLKNVEGCRTVLKDDGGGKFEAASICTVSGVTIISNGVTTYINDKLMHAETSAKYSPAFRGKTDETMTQDQQYIGDCPVGMKPGDLQSPDGIIRHTP